MNFDTLQWRNQTEIEPVEFINLVLQLRHCCVNTSVITDEMMSDDLFTN